MSKPGRLCKFYANTDLITGTTNAGRATAGLANITAGDEVTLARDITTNLTRETFEAASRGSDWDYMQVGLKDGTISGELLFKEDDPVFDLLESAFDNGTPVFLASLSGAYTVEGSRGLLGNYSVTTFTRNEPLRNTTTVTFEAKPHSDVAFAKVPAA